MRIDVVTLFAELFDSPLACGLLGKAIADGRAQVDFIDPREFTRDRHRTVDDAPYGGGAGMVMKPGPLARSIETARSRGPGPVLLMSPQGRPLRQADLRRWADLDHVILVAGRYEGYDDRVRALVDEEVSLGDFVLTGGEYAALTVIDGIVRLRPGTLGNAASSEDDSFSEGRLEHPQFTRPAQFEGVSIPPVLGSGDHEKVAAWRRMQAVLRTWERRPDLLESIGLRVEERRHLWQMSSSAPPLGLAVAMPPDPAALAALSGLATAYALTRAWVVPEPGGSALALEEALAAAPPIRGIAPWPPPKRRRDTPAPLEITPADRLSVAPSFEALAEQTDQPVALVGASRRWVAPEAVIAPSALQVGSEAGRLWTIAVGPGLVTGSGAVAANLRGVLPTLRMATAHPGMPRLAVAAVYLDRVRGER